MINSCADFPKLVFLREAAAKFYDPSWLSGENLPANPLIPPCFARLRTKCYKGKFRLHASEL